MLGPSEDSLDILSSEVRRKDGDAAQVKTTIPEHDQEYRKPPRRASDGDAEIGLRFREVQDPGAVGEHRRASLAGIEPPIVHFTDVCDQVGLDSQRGCMGRIFFQVPDGIARGQHWLNVKFAQSLVRVPFRILTEEEYKILDKNYKDIEKQVEEAFRKKG